MKVKRTRVPDQAIMSPDATPTVVTTMTESIVHVAVATTAVIAPMTRTEEVVVPTAVASSKDSQTGSTSAKTSRERLSVTRPKVAMTRQLERAPTRCTPSAQATSEVARLIAHTEATTTTEVSIVGSVATEVVADTTITKEEGILPDPTTDGRQPTLTMAMSTEKM